MILHTSSETHTILRVFQVFTVVAPTLFFILAGVASSFASTTSSRAVHGKVRRAQLALTFIEAILSCAEAVVDLKKSDLSRTWDPDAIYALFLTLLYILLSIGLFDNTPTALYPHYGAWTILLVCQGMVFALGIPGASSNHSLTHEILQGLQFVAMLTLLAGSLAVRQLQQPGTEEETQPLLATETSTTESTDDHEAKHLEEEEADRLRIRSRPFWRYLASFKVFVPYMYTKSRRLQLYFVGMCICTALSRVATVAYPLSLGAVVDGLGDSVPWSRIGLFVLLMFLRSSAGLPLIENYLSYRLTLDLGIALRRHCYDHLLNLSADFHENKRSSIVFQTMHHGDDVVDLFHDMVFQTLPQLIDLVSSVVVLTYLFGFYMTFIIFTTVILFYWLSFKALVTKRSLRRSWLDSYYEQHYQMTESLFNWSTVSYFGRIPYEIGKYQEKTEISREKALEWWSWECWSRGLRNMIPGITFMAACIVAALQIAHKQHRIGDFVTLITYWSQLTGPLSSIAGEFSRLVDKVVNTEKLVAILEKTPLVQDSPAAEPFMYLEGAVDFENVSFSYDGDRQVTKGIAFRAAPGNTVALVGQTGGGKSTIFRLLFRFYDVAQGRILIDGQDIRKVKMESFRKHIAMVPQNPVVFNMSVLENVRYPDIDCTEEEVIEACKAAALHDKIMSFTKGYQEKVGERGTKLSGGELQRLAIARAILKKADILLLDEATSLVDSVTEKKIQASIRQLCAGKTAFIIAHRLSTILHADHILVIRDGQIIEAGTHESLIKQDGAYNELWRSQLRVQADGRSRSRSRASRKVESQVLINDMNSSAEETQALVKNLSRSKDGKATENKTNVEISSTCDEEHPDDSGSLVSTDTRGRMISKRFADALSRRASRSKSAKKGHSSDSGLNPDAQTFRLSRSKSQQKDASSESTLNPGVQTFRPRRFQDGNNSASFSEEAAANENDCAIFPLKRKWAGHDREILGSSEDLGVDRVKGSIQDADGTTIEEPEDVGSDVKHYQISSVSGNIRRRKTASEPLLENATEDDDSDESSVDVNALHSARYSRLPQTARGRAVSAIDRKTVNGHMSGEHSPNGNELRAPVNTAATIPGIVTPGSNQNGRD